MTKGIKFDGEKPDHSLVPPFALDELARLLTIGAKKYAPNNWQKVKPKKRYYAAAARHLTQYLMAVLKGVKTDQYDEETGIHHLICVACNAMFLFEHETVYSQDEPFYGTDEPNVGTTETKKEIKQDTLDKLVEAARNINKPVAPLTAPPVWQQPHYQNPVFVPPVYIPPSTKIDPFAPPYEITCNTTLEMNDKQ
jgi:hypothetical protein